MCSLYTASILVSGCEEMRSAVSNNLQDILGVAVHKLTLSLIKEDDMHKVLMALLKILTWFSKSVKTRLNCKQVIEQLKFSLKDALIKKLQTPKNLFAITSCFLLIECNAEQVADIFHYISSSCSDCEEAKDRRYQFALYILNTKAEWVSQGFCLKVYSNIDKQSITFIVYQQIADICLQSNQVESKGLHLLSLWLQKINCGETRLAADMKNSCCICHNALFQDYIFSFRDQGQLSVIQIINKNWENLAKGSAKLVLECMRSLLKIRACMTHVTTFIKEMLLSVVNSVSNTRKTYLQLQLIFEFLHPAEVFASYPEIPMKLLDGLQSSVTSKYTTHVYKSILTYISREEWLEQFAPLFEHGLACGNRQLQHNLLILWVPCTLSQKPHLFKDLVGLTGANYIGLLSKIFILREARTKGLLNIANYQFRSTVFNNLYMFEYDIMTRKRYADKEELPFYDDIIDGIVHARSDIRSECFALLVSTKKPSEAVTMFEATLIKVFINANLSIDSSSFRMSLFKSFKFLCKRLFSLMTTSVRNDEKYCESVIIARTRYDNNEQLQLTNIPDCFDISFDLFYWLLDIMVESLILGGSYQRKLTALVCYREIVHSLYDNNGVSKKNAQPLQNLLLKFSREEFISKAMLPLLCNCADESEDIRVISLDLLSLISSLQNNLDEENWLLWLRKAFKLCNSPKANLAESGAFLLKTVRSLTRCFKYILFEHSIEVFPSLTEIDEDSSLLILLYDILESQLNNAKLNILKSCEETPMHGIIFAITTTVLSEEYHYCSTSSNVKKFIDKLFYLYQDIVHFCLQCLSPAGSHKESPSFAEMDSALRQLFADCSHYDSETGEVENVANGAEMILSCCWLSMKACCQSVASIIINFAKLMDTEMMKLGMESIVIHILLNTRHKGAMEAASLALSRLSEVINSTKICEGFLKLQLEKILGKLDIICEISLTRRAAGVAMIFASICESSNMLSLLFAENLIDVVRMNVVNSFSSVTDCPAVVGLHSLRAMMLNCRISSYLLPLYSQLVDICLDGFDSRQWVMRNASSQLFGALVTALVGQKKEREDTATFNNIYFTDFMIRHNGIIEKLSSALAEHVQPTALITCDIYSNLRIIFARVANVDIYTKRGFNVHCSTLPILSLLSRLEVGSDSSNILDKLLVALIPCLAHPVWTVRRLSAICIVKLTPKTEIPIITNRILNLFNIGRPALPSNLAHGLLFILLFATDYYHHLNRVSDLLQMLPKFSDYFKSNEILYSLYAVICSRVARNAFPPSSLAYYSRLCLQNGQDFSHNADEEFSAVLMYELNSGNLHLIENIVEMLSEKKCLLNFEKSAIALCKCYNEVNFHYKSIVIGILIEYINNCIITTTALSNEIIEDMMDALRLPQVENSSLNFIILYSYCVKSNHILSIYKFDTFLLYDKVAIIGNLLADEQHRMAAARCLSTGIFPLEFEHVQKLVPVCLNLLHDENESVREQALAAAAAILDLNADANPSSSVRAIVIFLFRSAFNNNNIDIIYSLFNFCYLQMHVGNNICLYATDIGNVYGEIIHTGKFISNVLLSCSTEKCSFSPQFSTDIRDFVSDNISLFRNELNINPMQYYLMDKNSQLNILIRINCLRFLTNLSKLLGLNAE